MNDAHDQSSGGRATERKRQPSRKPGPVSAVVGGSEGDETLLEPNPDGDDDVAGRRHPAEQSGTRGVQGKPGPTVVTGRDAKRRDG